MRTSSSRSIWRNSAERKRKAFVPSTTQKRNAETLFYSISNVSASPMISMAHVMLTPVSMCSSNKGYNSYI